MREVLNKDSSVFDIVFNKTDETAYGVEFVPDGLAKRAPITRAEAGVFISALIYINDNMLFIIRILVLA
jgi:hypothetical protein